MKKLIIPTLLITILLTSCGANTKLEEPVVDRGEPIENVSTPTE